MNRQTILNSIRRQLRDCIAERGSTCPLGEIVPRVAQEIRPSPPPPPVSHRVAIEQVAAFVDGGLSEQENAVVCQAVLEDNSVLAEVIAAVRGNEISDQRDPLSPQLSQRLLSMCVSSPATPADDVTLRPIESASVQNTDVDRIKVSQSKRFDPTDAPTVQPHVQTRRHTRVRNRRIVAAVAIAATLLGIVVSVDRFTKRTSLSEQGPVAVVDPVGAATDPLVDNPSAPALAEATVNDDSATDDEAVPTDRALAMEDSIVPTEASTDHPVTSETHVMTPNAELPGVEEIANADPKIETPSTDMQIDHQGLGGPDISVNVSPTDGSPEMTASHAEPIQVDQDSNRVDIQWAEVTGVLAQASDSGSSSGSTPRLSWQPVTSGYSTADRLSQTGNRAIALRTLPFSRAVGRIGDRGQIVMNEDTAMQLISATDTPDATVRLMYGEVAVKDMPPGTRLNVASHSRRPVSLRWQQPATVILKGSAEALTIQVDGEVEINDQVVHDKVVTVHEDQSTEIARAPRRLPKWVSQSPHEDPADRMILAQLANSQDLTESINRQIRVLVSTEKPTRDQIRLLNKLAAWQVAMAGPAIFRLAGSRVPAVRLAALQRLASMDESDPRYAATWRQIARIVGNQQRLKQIRAWLQLIRTRTRPNPVQMEALIAGLAHRDHATRALCDFILRTYVPNPPPYDPTWTGQPLQRAINVYRQRVGLPVIDRPRAADVNTL